MVLSNCLFGTAALKGQMKKKLLGRIGICLDELVIRSDNKVIFWISYNLLWTCKFFFSGIKIGQIFYLFEQIRYFFRRIRVFFRMNWLFARTNYDLCRQISYLFGRFVRIRYLFGRISYLFIKQYFW